MTEDKSSIDDLFKEEDIPFDIETEVVNEPTDRKRRMKILPVAIIALLIRSLFYLAYLNHERYYITADEGMVHIERGLFFPVGKMSYQPTVAYQPFALPKGGIELPSGSINPIDRDQILMNLLIRKATEELDNFESGDLDRAMSIFRRAYKLEQLDLEERHHKEFMGRFNMRKMYSTIGQIHGLLSIARGNADDARRQGVTSAQEWLGVIEKALNDVTRLAEREQIDLSIFEPAKVKPTSEPPKEE